MGEPAAKAFFSASEILDRYGITYGTLSRWIKNPDLGFPKPCVICGQRRFYVDEIFAWEASRPRQEAAPVAHGEGEVA